jgi:hypothetical protein
MAKKKVNMKLPKRKKDAGAELVEEPEGDRYPYGLEVRLEDESLNKLGMDALSNKVGSKMSIEADGVVEHASAHQRRNGKLDQSLTIQLTDISVDGVQEPEKSLFTQFNDIQNAGPGKVDEM